MTVDLLRVWSEQTPTISNRINMPNKHNKSKNKINLQKTRKRDHKPGARGSAMPQRQQQRICRASSTTEQVSLQKRRQTQRKFGHISSKSMISPERKFEIHHHHHHQATANASSSCQHLPAQQARLDAPRQARRAAWQSPPLAIKPSERV